MSEVDKLIKEIKSQENKPQASILQRFFKTGPGQYGAGDVFLGLKVPASRLLARQYNQIPLEDIEKLLGSKIHEVRLIGLLILVDKYEKTKERKEKKIIVDYYLAHTSGINNWDLVDLSVYKILGDFLLTDKRAEKILNKLAVSKNLWERRMAMVSTFAFIKAGRAEETVRLAKKLMKDEHDLMHKAVGWMLREAGKRVNKKALTDFLDENYRQLPRTALRYAIEHLKPAEREHYLLKK